MFCCTFWKQSSCFIYLFLFFLGGGGGGEGEKGVQFVNRLGALPRLSLQARKKKYDNYDPN